MKLLKILVVIVLFGIILFAILLASNYKVGYIELYMDNYQQIPKFNEDNFVFSFSIKNNNPDNVLIEYLFIQETGTDYIERGSEKLLLEANEERHFHYYINQTLS